MKDLHYFFIKVNMLIHKGAHLTAWVWYNALIVLNWKINFTHSEAFSFFSSLSSRSCFPGPEVCTPCDVTSGPLLGSELLLLLMDGDMLGLLGLLLLLLVGALLPLSLADSLELKSGFSFRISLGFSTPSRFFPRMWSIASGLELDCSCRRHKMRALAEQFTELMSKGKCQTN